MEKHAMSSFSFSVSPEIAPYLSRVLLQGESLDNYVITFAPRIASAAFDLGDRTLGEAVTDLAVTTQHVLNAGRIHAQGAHWVVGLSRRDRFPADDVVLFGDVACFLPQEMWGVLHGRRLVIREGELCVDPDPAPPS
jgi:Ser/Thr protein kinase RdoA (MazF antagonist)